MLSTADAQSAADIDGFCELMADIVRVSLSEKL